MNLISVQIYSDPNTPWNRNKIDFPIDPNTKWPGNGCGLCNQLFKLVNTLCYVDHSKHDIYIDLLSKDYLSGETTPISTILDLPAMRERHGYKIYDIMEFDYENEDFVVVSDPYVYRSYHSNRDLFSKRVESLIFRENLVDVAKKAIHNKGLSDSIVNLAHLRIDQDMKNHVFSTEGEARYDEIIDRYRNEIYSKCDRSIPLVLLLEDIEHPFVAELSKDYDVFFFEKKEISDIDPSLSGREMLALIDLLIGTSLDVDTYIGFEGSTFSLFIEHTKKHRRSYIIK